MTSTDNITPQKRLRIRGIENIPQCPHPTYRKFKDITGKSFGWLTVLYFGGFYHQRTSNGWACRCVCGNVILAQQNQLVGGRTTSCGCQKRCNNRTHGERSDGHTSKELGTFMAAKQRCRNPKAQGYKHYGGRGIEFRFESFEQFLAEVGRKPAPQYSLDRIDVNGHYECGNVRWATWTEQANNKRKPTKPKKACACGITLVIMYLQLLATFHSNVQKEKAVR